MGDGVFEHLHCWGHSQGLAGVSRPRYACLDVCRAGRHGEVCQVEVPVGGKPRWPGCRDHARRGQCALPQDAIPPGAPAEAHASGWLQGRPRPSGPREACRCPRGPCTGLTQDPVYSQSALGDATSWGLESKAGSASGCTLQGGLFSRGARLGCGTAAPWQGEVAWRV